ncbi:MAG: hypothetical protein MMC33_005425 [Icmadophila ericetorum]|nr:hypothetical protein [Icmadophila ericetorum]
MPDIHLITPPSSAKAIEAALSQNPHLTSLPLPRADILAPQNLTQTSGTAEILREPEVQAAVTGDFIVLPCDLVCELAGESLLEAWMIQQAGLGGVAASTLDYLGPTMGVGGEKGGRRGGLGVWFQTDDKYHSKDEETDFIITTALTNPLVPPPEGSLRSSISNLAYSTPKDTLKDITDEKKVFPIRHSLLRKHGRIRMLTKHRDAHIYLFPYWVLDMVKENEVMTSVSEDVVGWWAKAGWQDRLGDKLGLREILSNNDIKHTETGSHHSDSIEEDMDIGSMSATQTSTFTSSTLTSYTSPLASRISTPKVGSTELPPKTPLTIPPMLAYIQPDDPKKPLIRRVDDASLLLTISLHLATLPSSSDTSSDVLLSPLSHAFKIADPSLIAPRTTITASNTLLDANVTVEEKCVIKECCIGSNCTIKSGARLTRCVLMDGVTVGERVQLTGCVLGRRCVVGKEANLKDCEVQGGFGVEEGVEGKGEKFMVFEGLEDVGGDGEDEEGMGLEEEGEDEEMESS